METAKQLHEVVNVVTGMDTLNRTPLKDWNWPNRTLKKYTYSPSQPFFSRHAALPRRALRDGTKTAARETIKYCVPIPNLKPDLQVPIEVTSEKLSQCLSYD